MQVALVTEGTYPHHHGGVSVWCDQIVRGLSEHRYEVLAIVGSGTERLEWTLPGNVSRLVPVPLWAAAPTAGSWTNADATVIRVVQRFLECLGGHEQGPGFLEVLRQLFLAAQAGQLRPALGSRDAVELMLAHMRDREGPDGGSDRPTGSPEVVEARQPVLDPGPPDLHPPSRPTVGDAVQGLTLLEHYLRPLELRPRPADLCHAVSNGLASLPALAAKWLHGTPFLLTEHGLYLRERLLAHRPGTLAPHVRALLVRFFKRLVAGAYTMADCIAPVSRYCELWELQSGADASRIRPIHNGIDPDRFVYDPDEPDEPVLVFVGRIDPLKDVETLLRAFALVREAEPRARLRMFGPTDLPEYARRCDALLVRLGLRGSASFEGRVDMPASAYRAARVVLLTSISEGFPFAVLEAMACGRPVVATDVGGVAEAVGDSGVLVPPRDPTAVAEAAVALLRDDEERRSLGRRARERVVTHFTVESCVASYRRAYDEAARSACRPDSPVARHALPSPGRVQPDRRGPPPQEPVSRPPGQLTERVT